MKILTNLDLNKNELQNVKIQNLLIDPPNPAIGQIYYNSSANENKFYGYNGTKWLDLGQSLTEADIYSFINNSTTLKIDDDNLSQNVNDAISAKHSQNTDNTLTSGSANTINTNGAGNIVDFKVSGTPKSSIDKDGKFTGTSAIATNIAGGSAGTIPYQSGANTTAMLSAGSSGQILKSNGTNPPSWQTLDLTYLPDASIKKSVRCATTADIGVVTPTSTTLTGSMAVFPPQDGVVIGVGDRILVKNQSTSWQNGIYYLKTQGVAGTVRWVLERPSDSNSELKIVGSLVNVENGTINGGAIFTTNFKSTSVIGTDDINWYKVQSSADTSTLADANKLVLRNSAGDFSARWITASKFIGNADTASKLATTRNIELTGDVTGNINFDGSGDVDIATTLSNVGTNGTYTKVTTDAKGRVTSGTTLGASDIPTLTSGKITDFDTQVRTSALNQMAQPTDNVSMNNKKITSLAHPSDATDAVTKAYADSLRAGLFIKEPVRVASDGSVDIANFNLSVKIDGVTLIVGDRVLLKDQPIATQNGIWVVASQGNQWFRPDDAKQYNLKAGSAVWVNEGTKNRDSRWVLTSDNVENVGDNLANIGSVPLIFTKDFQGSDIINGTGLNKSGNTLSIDDTVVTLTGTQTLQNKTLKGAVLDAHPQTTDNSLAVASTGFVKNQGYITGISSTNVTSALGYTPPKKYVGTITGDGTTTQFTAVHSLGTMDCTVTLRTVASPYEVILADVQFVDNNTLKVLFGSAVANSVQYKITVIG